jgi:hypothetical protein
MTSGGIPFSSANVAKKWIDSVEGNLDAERFGREKFPVLVYFIIVKLP